MSAPRLLPAEAEAFLAGADWARAVCTPLAGDASGRSYLRLTRDAGDTAIMMRAPVLTEADRASLSAFLRVGDHLAALGLSTPAVIAAHPAAGMLLIEDFGDRTLAHLLAIAPAAAHLAYGVTATDVLRVLATARLPDWAARPDAAAQVDMITLTLAQLPKPDGFADLRAALADTLARHCAGPPVLALRDCHGDNLMWLPDRHGAARIGLLDYQDAVALPLGYDLASLVDDPRRALPEGWREALIARFATALGLPLTEIEARVAVLSLLRNLRILGIFHRLATQMGKPRYRAFLPRTGDLIDRAARHPALAPLRAPVARLRDMTKGWAA